MNINTPNDLFIFNFPSSFIPPELEIRYKPMLKNFRKPYSSVIDYINSTIQDITLPAMTFPTVKQREKFGKEVDYRGSISPYDLYARDFTVNLAHKDFHITYFIIQDALLYHFMGNVKFIDDFTITTLDEERREMFKLYLSEITPSGLSDTRLGNQLKDVSFQTYTISFKFNYIDIEFMPTESNPSNNEIIEEYSKRIIPNDDQYNIPPEPDENIIGH